MLHFHYNPETIEKENQDLAQKRPAFKIRANIDQAIRHFFDAEQFLEVHTPVRLAAPALEDYIDAIPAGDQWLRTSPELHMKQLLAAGYPKIYQIGPCFRQGENGSRHLPEFTMLEWYRLNADWLKIKQDTVRLIQQAAENCLQKTILPFRDRQINLSSPWDEITVRDAFLQFADCTLQEALDKNKFEEILVEQIEPHLGQERPCFLTEYPLSCSGLSSPIPGRPDFVERWELYIAGIELGNACSELVDLPEQERRFQACAALRASENRPVYPVDQPFMNALKHGIPSAAGVAIGIDRLVMFFCNCNNIHKVTL